MRLGIFESWEEDDRGHNREPLWDNAGRDLQSGLENDSAIVGVAAAVLWKDGRISAGWSNLDPASLSRMILMLDEKQRRDTIHDTDLEP